MKAAASRRSLKDSSFPSMPRIPWHTQLMARMPRQLCIAAASQGEEGATGNALGLGGIIARLVVAELHSITG